MSYKQVFELHSPEGPLELHSPECPLESLGNFRVYRFTYASKVEIGLIYGIVMETKFLRKQSVELEVCYMMAELDDFGLCTFKSWL